MGLKGLFTSCFAPLPRRPSSNGSQSADCSGGIKDKSAVDEMQQSVGPDAGVGVVDSAMQSSSSGPQDMGSPEQRNKLDGAVVEPPRSTKLRGLTDEYVVFHDSPVRQCMQSKQLTAKMRRGGTVSVLYFYSLHAYKRHVGLCGKPWMMDFGSGVIDTSLPLTTAPNSASAAATAAEPLFAVHRPSSTLDEVLGSMVQVEQHAFVPQIIFQLARLLAQLHSNQTIHMRVCRNNVVMVHDGATSAWTLREFSSWARKGTATRAIDQLNLIRLVPPENGRAARTRENVAAAPSMDIFQLGVVMLELYTGSPFWGEMSDDEVATALCTPGCLPCERDPDFFRHLWTRSTANVAPVVRRTLEAMLSRDPQARPQATQVMAAMGVVDDGTLYVRTMNPADIPHTLVLGSRQNDYGITFP